MKKIWLSAYSPTRNATFFVRSCGHCRVNKEHREKARIINFSNFYWCVEGHGFFNFENRYCKIGPGEVWYTPPGALQDFYPGDDGFHYYWLALEGEAIPTVERMLKLTPGKKFCGNAPAELFQQIIIGLRHLTPERRLEILGIAFQILFQIATAVPEQHETVKTLAAEAQELIEREFTNPSFNINRLAELLTIHRVTLCREFKQAFRISPSEYLKGCRLRKAIEMLPGGEYSIKETAYACGFSSPEYFSTVFSAEFGTPPSHFTPRND